MTSKKPAKKAGTSAVKSPAAVIRTASPAPPGKKSVVTRPLAPQPVAEQQPVRHAVASVTLKESVKQTPATTPFVESTAPVKTPTREVSGEELYNRIQFHAYLLAEKDGFKADPVHYWVQAERAAKTNLRKTAGT
jgi:hypothetical protein